MRSEVRDLLLASCALICSGSSGLLQAQTVAISPGYTNLGVNATLQYKATVTGLPNTAVTWMVNGATGGNATIGTISTSGLYTAPASVPTVSTLVEALASDGKTMGVVYVNIEPAGPTVSAVSPNPVAMGNFTATLTGSGFKSGATVLFNGAAGSATFINSTTLKFSGYQGSAAPGTVQVQNPGTLWGAPFTIPFTNNTQTIDPRNVSLAVGTSKQFTSPGATSWTATAGTITQSGLYTAPVSVPASAVTVSATGPNGTAIAIVTIVQGGTQTISPTSMTLNLGATQQFTSAGATSWSATAGTIVAGLYTAPATMPASNKVTITATGPGGSASALVTLTAGAQTIAPTAATVLLGATQQFSSAGATSWTATAGSVSAAGLYTAPASMPASNTVTVTATGPGGSASATVTLVALQTIAPTSATVVLGASQQFTSAGATSWTATAGTVTAAGLYTAPASMPASNLVTITATGPGGSASATVTLTAPAPPPAITSVTPLALPLGVFNTSIAGSGFTAQSVVKLNGVPLVSTFAGGALNVTGFSSQSGAANITVSNGNQTSQPYPVQIGVQNPQVSAAAARRFLEQAAFGPTPADSAHVQTVGISGWLAEQFAMPTISNFNGISGNQGGLPARFLANAVTNPDQLRQRVAFALSQIFVVSLNTLIWNDNMILFQQMLANDAFTNYRQIMSDVTLSPGMGQYLNMANNAKASLASGSVANENYARELMQLFTIGTNLLNLDGTLQLDANHLPIPTYSQFTVTEFARVFTGWTYAPAAGQPVNWNSYISSYGPMVPYPPQHDAGSKTLLNGAVAQAGLDPLSDLNFALDNIFNHPNAGPFVAVRLIQHLVKSNPSPAYVSAVASVFNNNGSGVRGDMKAVITAILTNPEARGNDNGGLDQPTDGHLQEPALFVPGVVRAFGGTMTDQNYYPYDLTFLGQDLFNAPSVFNYYSPMTHAPGTSLIGGEFQIDTPNAAIYRANVIANLFGQYSNPVQSNGPGTTLDLTPYLALASNPSLLVDALDLTLTHGTMPAAMKSEILAAVTGDSAGSLHRVQTGCYLILTSGYYNVWH